MVGAICSKLPAERDQPLESLVAGASPGELWETVLRLDAFRRESENLYERVRALYFLAAICRYYLPSSEDKQAPPGHISERVHAFLLERRFAEAIDALLAGNPSTSWTGGGAPLSALGFAFYQLGLQNLADQVRKSVREVRGNQWMFRCGHPSAYCLSLRKELTLADDYGLYPILRELTAVRMDLSHSAWSDIFFLGMDFPEAARVLNVSVNLAVEGRDGEPAPPVSGLFRVIDEPVLRLTSVDLGATADITNLGELFDFAKDYLGLLKAAVISSGLVPIGMEGSGTDLRVLLERLAGPGRGIELVSVVNDIPKGSRLAVSTNLLGSLIAVCMRATGQTASLTGPLLEKERRIVAARAILGEWLGGSGGGWQDSGGVWPGIKVISGCPAGPQDPEYGISRGRLLPSHRILDFEEVSPHTRSALAASLVLVHGGMAQNVGPVLEMVTERYLLRSAKEWEARKASCEMFDEILDALRSGSIRRLGELTTNHFFGPLQTIIPWASNRFTEEVIARTRQHFQGDFWGFWMLGGMSGGGMGFIFDPARATEAKSVLLEILQSTKRELECALPFSMEPVIYRFLVNENGSTAELLTGAAALMPPPYYPLMIPALVRNDPRTLPPARRNEASLYGHRAASEEGFRTSIQALVGNLLPKVREVSHAGGGENLDALLERLGFDAEAHERIRSDLKSGLTGLAQNRLHPNMEIDDVPADAIFSSARDITEADLRAGRQAIADGELAIVSLAAGVGSRWTEGAGVVKAVCPFYKFADRHRSFVETHLAKSRATGQLFGTAPAHVFTTGYMTHSAIEQTLRDNRNFGFEAPLHLSFGRSVGLRLIPMERDLRFAFEQAARQTLDERKQKMRESIHAALLSWAKAAGEGSDYRDNLPQQCLHPVGHWFEIPNLLLNGTLAKLLEERPGLRTLLLHNIDTVGVNADPGLLGLHRRNGAGLTFEVIPRRLEDRGGGLARVGNSMRLIEGMALPREEDEYKLSFYNTLTTWIEIDALLSCFGLSRVDLSNPELVASSVRKMSARLPTYITLKEVKKRWGHGQEDILPVAQFEKLWGDMTALRDISSAFVVVDRSRGQQLKAQSQLDSWMRDGSAAAVDALCAWV